MTDPPFEENYYKTINSFERQKNKKIFFLYLSVSYSVKNFIYFIGIINFDRYGVTRRDRIEMHYRKIDC